MSSLNEATVASGTTKEPVRRTRQRPSKTRYLEVGDVFTLHPVKKGEASEVTYRAMNCSEPNLKANPPEICAGAALFKAFQDQPVGFKAFVPRGGKQVEMRLHKISRGATTPH